MLKVRRQWDDTFGNWGEHWPVLSGDECTRIADAYRDELSFLTKFSITIRDLMLAGF